MESNGERKGNPALFRTLGNVWRDTVKSVLSPASILLAFLAGLALTLAYRGPFLDHFIDVQYPGNPSQFVASNLFAWSPLNGGIDQQIGIFTTPSILPYVAFELLGAPPWFSQFATNLLELWLAGLGMFLLTRRLFPRPESSVTIYPRVAAASFYMFSMVSVGVLFWDFIPYGPLLLAILPFQILLLIKGFDAVNSSRIGLAVSLVLFSALISVGSVGANEPIAVSAVFLIVGFGLWFAATGPFEKFPSRIGYLVVTLLVIVGVNSYWILPDFALSNAAGATLLGGSTYSRYVTNFAYTQSLTPIDGLQLLGIQAGAFSWYAPVFAAGSVLGSIALMPLLFLLVLPVLRLTTASRDYRGTIIGLWVLLLIAVLLYAGEGAPLLGEAARGILLQPLYVEVFQNTGSAIGLAVAFLESPLLALGGIEVIRLLSRKPRAFIAQEVSAPAPARSSSSRKPFRSFFRISHTEVIPVILVVAVVVPATLPGLSGSILPSKPYQALEEIPPYEFGVASYINTNAGTNYTLLAPGGFQEANWTDYGGHGYDGYDVLLSLITSPVIAGTSGELGSTNPLVTAAYSYLEYSVNNTDYARLLSLLRIEFVVIEGGIGGGFPFNLQAEFNLTHAIDFLDSQPNISLVRTFGPDTVFRNENPLPPMLSSPVEVSNSSEVSLNITQMYYDACTIHSSPTSLVPPLYPQLSGSGGFLLAASSQQQQAGFAFPGYATTYNLVPLGISIAQYPYLSLSIRTNAYTALSVGVSDATELSEGSFNNEWFGTAYYSVPTGNAIPNPGWYYSPYGTINLTINLLEMYSNERTLVTNPANGTINYLYLALAPTYGNSTELLQAPKGQPHPLQASVLSISLGIPYFLGNTTTAPRKSILATNASLTNPIGSPVTAQLLEQNVTREYAGLTQANSTLNPPIRASINSDGTFELSANVSQQTEGFAFPGYAVAFNVFPLNISVNAYPFLTLRFETSTVTALSFGFSTVAYLNESDYNQAWYPEVGFTFPSSNTEPSNVWYYSPDKVMEVTIDLQQSVDKAENLTTGPTSQQTSFVYIALTQTLGNATLAGSQSKTMISNLTATVDALEFGKVPANSTLNASALLVPSLEAEVEGGDLLVNASKDQLLSGLQFPGYPVAFNLAPLDVSVTRYPYLAVSFETGQYTAVQFSFTDASSLSPAAFASEWYSTQQFASPASNAVPNGGWYYSPDNVTTVVVNLASAISSQKPVVPNPQGFNLTFISFTLVPTYGNSTEYLGPLNQSTAHNLSLVVSSIEALSAFQSNGSGVRVWNNGTDISPLVRIPSAEYPPFEPGVTAVFDDGRVTSPLSAASLSEATPLDPSDWKVSVSAHNATFSIVLYQNFNAGWSLEESSGQPVTITQVLVDGYANGWVVSGATQSGALTFDLRYEGQNAIDQGVAVTAGTLAGIATISVLVIAVPRVLSRSRRRIDSAHGST